MATDFEHRSFAQELALCQRYFFQATEIGSTSEVTNRPICIGTMFSSSDMRGIIDFPVEMREQPLHYHQMTQVIVSIYKEVVVLICSIG